MAPWSNYPIDVTLYKDTELKSSSVYNQNSPTLPIVNFEEFLGDNNDITDQDLVAYEGYQIAKYMRCKEE